MRNLARRAGVQSPSYFNLVVKGQRKLSVDYAYRFAQGLELDDYQTRCLVLAADLEQTTDEARRQKLLSEMEALRKRATRSQKMTVSHVEILSDLVSLKLYLLAQSKKFRLEHRWLLRKFGGELKGADLERRIETLFASGLWSMENNKVRTCAPVLKTGSYLREQSLRRTHENILENAKRSLLRSEEHRVHGGRTFLFNPAQLKKIERRIEEFRQELEHEFEDLQATEVFQLHVSFFELFPEGK